MSMRENIPHKNREPCRYTYKKRRKRALRRCPGNYKIDFNAVPSYSILRNLLELGQWMLLMERAEHEAAS
jgi:hypothetical protein